MGMNRLDGSEYKEGDKMMMVKRVIGGEVDTDQESNGSSSEEMESPRSVTKVVRRWEKKTGGVGMYLHSQILRIRDEDSHIGEDISEVLNLCAKDINNDDDKRGRVAASQVVVFAKPTSRPASPLGGRNTAVKTVD